MSNNFTAKTVAAPGDYDPGGYYYESGYYGQGPYYYESGYYGQAPYYSQATYYDQSGYYGQSGYYDQSGYYGQSSYAPEYAESPYYTQNGYYTQSTYGPVYTQSPYYGQATYAPNYSESTYSQYLQSLYAGYVQSLYAGYGQTVYNTYSQAVYSGYTQPTYAGYTQSTYPVYSQDFYYAQTQYGGGPYTQPSYTPYNQSIYPGYVQNVYAGYTQTVYAGYTQNPYASYTQTTYAGYTQSLYAGYTQSLYSSYTQAIYPAYAQSTYPPYAQPTYAGYTQGLYSGYIQALYAGYTQGVYAGYSQPVYAPGYAQPTYGYSQSPYPGYTQGLYLGYSQAVYPPYAQNSYPPVQSAYPSQTTYYTQGVYGYSQVGYYSQAIYGYTQGTYGGYTQGTYAYSQSLYPYTQGTYGGGANQASCISFSAPATVVAGQSFSASTTIRNVGTNTWVTSGSNPYGFTSPEGGVYPGPGPFGSFWLSMPSSNPSVSPLEDATFEFTAAATSTPGTYNFKFQMLQHNVGWFGSVCSQTITVTTAAVVPDPPVGSGSNPLPTADNSTCGQITISWGNPSGGGPVTNYRVYRLNSALGNTFADSDTQNISGDLSNSARTYIDSTVSGTTTYYYWVEARGPGGNANSAISGNSIAAIACFANLANSDKDIKSVTPKNGTIINYSTVDCNATPDPNTRTFRINDKIRFRLNICNNSALSKNTASNIVVTDTLTNLQQVGGNWNVGGTWGALVPVVTGTAPNQTLTFTVPTSLLQGTAGYIEFDAETITTSSNNTAYFQNSYSINYSNPTPNTSTGDISNGLHLFYRGSGSPSIIEVAP